MPFLEVKNSGPDVPDGAYPMILVAIEGDPEIPNSPRHVVPEQGPNAGKDLYFWDWKFRINIPGDHPLNATEPFSYGTSTATGPRSKMYGVLTALLNGSRPTVGMTFEKDDLIGRQVYATVQRSETGYCDIVGFSPVPAHLQQQAFAAATAAPQAPAAPPPGAQPQFTPQQIIPPQPQPAGPLPNQVDGGQFGVAGPQPPASLREQVAPTDRPNDALPF
jgi:hypothetical protein